MNLWRRFVARARLRRANRIRPLRPVDTVMATLVGLACLIGADRLREVHDTTVQPWPTLWPILFLLSGVCCLWFAYCSREVRCKVIDVALTLSGSITVTTFTSRAVILGITALHNDTAVQTEKLELGVIIWLLLALLTGYVWLHVFRPAVALSTYRDD